MDNLLHSITARVAAFGCFLLVSACDGPENFSWENHPTLSWDDFRGTGFKPGFAAETYSGLTRVLICKGGTLDVSVAAEFWPFTSWVRPDRKADLLLLKHEQGHFDITELYARKLRKAIRETRISCEHIAYAEAAGTRIVNQESAAQDQYDTDTKGGKDPVAQAAASNGIANELSSLDSYKFHHQTDCSESKTAICKERNRVCYDNCLSIFFRNQRASCYQRCELDASNCYGAGRSLERRCSREIKMPAHFPGD